MSERRIPKGIITVGLLVIGLFVFELFNYHTSRIALDDIFTAFGSFPVFGRQLTLGTLLAMGAATIDIGGILRIFTPEQGEHEPDWVRSAYTFWLLATVINAGLTYWIARLGLESARRIPTELVGQEVWIAVVIAVFVWAIRYGLVRNLATTGDEFIHVQLPGPNLAVTRPVKTVRKKKKRKVPVVPSLQFSTRRPASPTPTGVSPYTSLRTPENWDKDKFLLAYQTNPRLRGKTKQELASIAGVSDKTIYRWLKEIDSEDSNI